MKRLSFIVVLMVVTLIGLMGCGSPAEETSHGQPNEEATGEFAADRTDALTTIDGSDTFFHSAVLDENGFFAGIRAMDYVELFEYRGFFVPRSVHYVPEDIVQAEIDSIVEWFQLAERIYDRLVEDGDRINIDFVGSIDGVEFEGGNSFGMGTEVVAGSEEFIGDFLTQLIGTAPGDTVYVEVSFPDDYWEPSLAGVPALFVTTVNFILGEAALTDADVAEHLSEDFGWATVDDVRAAIRGSIQESAVMEFVRDYIMNHVESAADTNLIPAALLEHFDQMAISQLTDEATRNDLSLDEYLADFFGYTEGIDEFLSMNRDGQIREISFHLLMQAIAEDAGITITESDLDDYFLEMTGSPDYSMFEEMYGLPFLKQASLSHVVFNYISSNALLE